MSARGDLVALHPQAPLAKVRALRRRLKRTTHGYDGTGSEWRAAMALLDSLEADLKGLAASVLGPVVAGGRPLTEHDLTHATGGLSHYPAFDDGFGHPGRTVLAPETLTVTRLGHAVRRDGTPNGRSLYATGASGLRYWFGHLDDPVPAGRKVRKGGRLGVISANHEAPHVHVGIDARAVIGRELDHHTNYTHGAPTVGAQLAQK